MNSAGWEVRPLGWLLLAILLCAAVYFTWTRLRGSSQKNEDKIH